MLQLSDLTALSLFSFSVKFECCGVGRHELYYLSSMLDGWVLILISTTASRKIQAKHGKQTIWDNGLFWVMFLPSLQTNLNCQSPGDCGWMLPDAAGCGYSMSHRWLGTRATGTVQWGMVFLSYCCYRILYPSRKQKTQLSPVYLASSCKSSFLFPIILPFHWWPQPFILEEAKFDFPSPTGSFEMATAVLSQWTSQSCWDY